LIFLNNTQHRIDSQEYIDQGNEDFLTFGIYYIRHLHYEKVWGLLENPYKNLADKGLPEIKFRLVGKRDG
jgi:hypothetical protein